MRGLALYRCSRRTARKVHGTRIDGRFPATVKILSSDRIVEAERWTTPKRYANAGQDTWKRFSTSSGAIRGERWHTVARSPATTRTPPMQRRRRSSTRSGICTSSTPAGSSIRGSTCCCAIVASSSARVRERDPRAGRCPNARRPNTRRRSTRSICTPSLTYARDEIHGERRGSTASPRLCEELRQQPAKERHRQQHRQQVRQRHQAVQRVGDVPHEMQRTY